MKYIFIRCYYVLTVDPCINIARVAARVMAGGHDVPQMLLRGVPVLSGEAGRLASQETLYCANDGHEASLIEHEKRPPPTPNWVSTEGVYSFCGYSRDRIKYTPQYRKYGSLPHSGNPSLRLFSAGPSPINCRV